MPLAVFSTSGGERLLGKVFGDRIIGLAEAAPELPRDAKAFLAAGAAARERFHAVRIEDGRPLALSGLRLHAPIPDPEKFLGIGMNYADHSQEAEALGLEKPQSQKWFNKQVSCITGPHDDIVKPVVSDDLDYEVELAVVIGKACRNVAREEARSVIGGYMIVNDVSVRDWQFRSPTVTLGKSFDTHGPTGPWLTLDEEIADPHDLELRTFVNGDLRQQGNTRHLIYDIYDQITYLSQVMTLKPGDILATGTPAGVGIAFDPPKFLRPGDVVRLEIAGLGQIENRVVAPEPRI
ncbi:MAG: 5-carboxymethyl-2-hydroxymuconate isomerase [Pelagibacterium sp. SCN 64-44]|nr:MAG: 5-carboxymethyl-2-hydroxymuconate isomerase [Pelagibacterium sp. SCN 64-44]